MMNRPHVHHAQSGNPFGASPVYAGYFGHELKTCDTIEESLKSFDELEEYRRQLKERKFAYKS